MNINTTSFAVIVNMSYALNGFASVTEFTNKADWQSAAGQFTTINFTDYPQPTLITSQYADQGVLFTDGADFIVNNKNTFENDGFGLFGAIDEIALSFIAPMTSIAVDFPGLVKIKLYNDGQLIYTSNLFSGPDPTVYFGGLISTDPFDAAIIYDPLGGVFIDDLHFGPPIPAPSALALIGMSTFFTSRRRRSAE